MSFPAPPMSVSGIQGQLLEVTVVGCNKLKDTEWISRQDPYVCLEYGSTKFKTRTCTDGGKNPTFQEKFLFKLIEGLRELNVNVWNSNTLSYDDFIGSGKVQLQKVLSEGYDDTAWSLQSKSGRYAGEVRLILHYANARKPTVMGFAPMAPPYMAPSAPQGSLYAAPSPAATAYYPSVKAYPAQSAPQGSLYAAPLPAATASYPSVKAYTAPSPSPCPYPSYPPNPEAYPPSPYPPQPAPYPPLPYPPSTYPPQWSPPPQASPCYPPGPYPEIYPPPPY